jgi:CBS domain-containing protein
MAHTSNRNQATKKVMADGPKNTKSRVASRDGQIMSVASRDVISTYPQNAIKKAASLMRDHDVRRLPILHPGTRSLEGLVTAVDILDYLGGGPKYYIIGKDYGGNFLSAINGPISKIMRESQYLPKSARIEDAITSSWVSEAAAYPWSKARTT